jgi:hypothetical protein
LARCSGYLTFQIDHARDAAGLLLVVVTDASDGTTVTVRFPMRPAAAPPQRPSAVLETRFAGSGET